MPRFPEREKKRKGAILAPRRHEQPAPRSGLIRPSTGLRIVQAQLRLTGKRWALLLVPPKLPYIQVSADANNNSQLGGIVVENIVGGPGGEG